MTFTSDDVADRQTMSTQAAASRRAFAESPMSRFEQKMREVMREYLAARAQGVSREDAVKGIEEVLRAEWPRRTSKFLTCAGCDGTGWHLTVCTHDVRCQRQTCQEKHPAWEHTFVVPCECDKGDPFRPRLVQPDDLGDVAKTRKRRQGSWTRFGG